jgi:predicted RNA-binding Zn-ribbon protein involved in translation (DUF1610 family)
MTTENKDAPICPSCGGFIPNNQYPGKYPGALSRKDNKTEICSSCGIDEALADFFKSTTSDRKTEIQ